MSKNCIYLKTNVHDFRESLKSIVFDYPVNNPEINFDAIGELQLEHNKFGNNIFIGDVHVDEAFVSLVAPQRVGMYSALPYLNYLIMQQSPGTNLLARAGFDLPQWFFRSTCTDIALSTFARDYYFKIKLKDRAFGGEMELWYEMVRIKDDFGKMLRMLVYYSVFPVGLLALLTDFAILPVLNTMMPVEIKAIYIFAFILFFPVPFNMRFDHKFALLINAGIIALSYFITIIPDRYLLPDSGLVLMILGLFFVMFFAVNFYTISRMPLVIEGIFVKAIRGLK
ncbi:MAG: hypothetical protein O2962_09050 [Cyanobacteria bacterium]|nr:hypothetical protein [Cyanobacteriota bacterium]